MCAEKKSDILRLSVRFGSMNQVPRRLRIICRSVTDSEYYNPLCLQDYLQLRTITLYPMSKTQCAEP